MALLDDYALDRRFSDDEGTVFLTGLQALARLPLEQLRADRLAGHSTAAFVSGYQGSPLGTFGEVVQQAARAEPDADLVFRAGLNEEYAATAIMGSQLAAARPDARYDGVVGLWYGKAPGVDRAADALRHAVFAGTSMLGGAVALVGDDPNAKSSTVPSSSAGLLADMHMPLLYPGDPAEALDLGRHAIALSRATGLWSALKIVADVADATASVELHPDRVQPVMPLIDGQRYAHEPNGLLLTPRTVDVEREIVEVRYELARRYAAENQLNLVTVDPPDAWIGIIASGITSREVREALARLGLDSDDKVRSAGIRLLKMRMPMPFEPATVRRFARGLEQVLVIEEKQPNIESLVKDALYGVTDRPRVVGKHDEAGRTLLPAWGGLDADLLVPVLHERLSDRLGDRLAPLPRRRTRIPVTNAQRTPFFCSGCPHNRSTVVPEGTVVGAGIGCHTMVVLSDDDRYGDVAGITCMGNEGTQWIGMGPFVETPHFVQNLGDGTYFHSGQLAIRAAVDADINVTYKILFNGTVAMTGGQDPVGGVDLASVATSLLAVGVKRVVVTSDDPAQARAMSLPPGVDVFDRSELDSVQRSLAAVPGVTVLIHDQACAAELRRARRRGTIEVPDQRVVINERICEGCGDCGQVSNCLSVQPVETEFGRKTTIDQTSCNLDFSCLDGDCPSFMTVHSEPGGRVAKALRTFARRGQDAAGQRAANATHEPPVVPPPSSRVTGDDFALRITGIGGTGVVTVSQILGTAAMLDGWHVRGLDQIGLSQKAGPVVSDVRLSRQGPSFTNRLGSGQADLLLAFDQLVAASDAGLDTVSDSTIVVGSSTATPTGDMIAEPSIALPRPAELERQIGAVTDGAQHWADAQALTTRLFGTATSANLFVVGMAIQAGALPIAVDALHRAIELNGVAVETNLAAVAWGRSFVHDPASIPSDPAAPAPGPSASASEWSDTIANLGLADPNSPLGARIARLADELVDWGSKATARTYLDRLASIADAAGTDTQVLAAAAEGLFKLSAYKDEYEVARLMVDDDALADARALAGDDGRIVWRLHPPALRALGVERKISVGEWATPAVRLLAKGKRLRGTPLDLFGLAGVRRVERQLPGEYVDAIVAVAPTDPVAALAIAHAADTVRGYEGIKLANVARFREIIWQHARRGQTVGHD